MMSQTDYARGPAVAGSFKIMVYLRVKEAAMMSQTTPTDLETYLRRVAAGLTFLDFSIFQQGQERDFSSVPLDQFYVPLRLAGRAPLEEAGPAQISRSTRNREALSGPPDISSTQLLAPEQRLARHLVLLGDAGSGKTTLLRHLAGALALARLKNDPALARRQTGHTGDPLLPIFIPLRYFHHFCRGNSTRRPIAWGSFMEFLPHYFQEQQGLTLPPDFFSTLLTGGGCLLALDGFDEVPDPDSRRQVMAVVRALAADADLGRNTLILSSRVAAYGGAAQLGGRFQTLWVQNLNAEERTAQVNRWVDGIRPYTQRDLKAADILRRMAPGSPLAELAVTPLIVTTLCVVYFYDHELPEQRAQLYQRCIEIMLYEKLRPDDPGQILAERGGKPDFKRELLARLAFEMHLAQADETAKEPAARWLKDGFRSLAEEERLPAAYDFLDNLTSRGTLLQERAGQFGFGRQHLTFKEYLAGAHLIRGLRERERQPLWPRLLLDDRWREPIRLAAGSTVFSYSRTTEDFLHELLALADPPETGPATRLAAYRLAAESLVDVGQSGRMLLEKELQSQIITGLAARLGEKAIAAPAANLLKERLAGAAALGRLGDPREGVATLPPLLTADIEGRFQYGKKNEERETAPFQAAIYPVTNAQFEQFWRAGGYNQKNWWSEAGWQWRQGKPAYNWQKMDRPDYWDDDRYNQANQPVVGVTWYEAEAFCHWLTDQARAINGRLYRLPTELEWERLARGQHGRVYPWGNTWEEGLANTDESKIGRPSAVGLFPEGVSPTGAYDCAGNVREWCVPEEGIEQTFRVVRGGSWVNNQDDARCVSRRRSLANDSNDDLGFRVVSPILS